MDWIEEYKLKVTKGKMKGLYVLLGTIPGVLVCVLFALIFNSIYGLFVGLAVFGGIANIIVGIDIMLSYKMVYRKYNGNYICFYITPLKNYLIINDEIQCEGGVMQLSYYGQLDDGTDVMVRVSAWNGDKQFIIGGTQNHTLNIL